MKPHPLTMPIMNIWYGWSFNPTAYAFYEYMIWMKPHPLTTPILNIWYGWSLLVIEKCCFKVAADLIGTFCSIYAGKCWRLFGKNLKWHIQNCQLLEKRKYLFPSLSRALRANSTQLTCKFHERNLILSTYRYFLVQ